MRYRPTGCVQRLANGEVEMTANLITTQKGYCYPKDGKPVLIARIVDEYRLDYDLSAALQRIFRFSRQEAREAAERLLTDPTFQQYLMLARLKDTSPKMGNKRMFIEGVRELCTHFDPKVQIMALKLLFDYMKETGEIKPEPQKVIDIQARLAELDRIERNQEGKLK